MKKPSLFSGHGCEMPYQWVHVPLAYTRKILPKGKHLCILEASKNKVVVTLRNEAGYTVGMMKHLRLFTHKVKGKYFEYKGTKIFLKDVVLVL